MQGHKKPAIRARPHKTELDKLVGQAMSIPRTNFIVSKSADKLNEVTQCSINKNFAVKSARDKQTPPSHLVTAKRRSRTYTEHKLPKHEVQNLMLCQKASMPSDTLGSKHYRGWQVGKTLTRLEVLMRRGRATSQVTIPSKNPTPTMSAEKSTPTMVVGVV
jgi:hypothetical protein